jgi:hypothetical protein
MKSMAHPELAYSFQRVKETVGVKPVSASVLLRVHQQLVEASRAFVGRRYIDAIALYQEVRQLLWTQLFPTTPLIESDAWQIELFVPLVSYGGEWLNVLPVEQPVTGVRPRVEVPADTGPRLGLTSGAIDADGISAIADLEAADLLNAQGNAEAARFFRDRATNLAPELVDTLDVARDSGTPAAAPVVGDRWFDGVSPAGALAVGSPVAALPVAGIPAAITAEQRTYAATVGDDVERVAWAAGASPDVDELVAKVYDGRRKLEALPDVLIQPEREADGAVALAHAWYYETPLGLAECHHALGDWETAATWYERAAGYRYLNANIEAPYVWSRLAMLYRDWGDSLFRADEPEEALPIYERVLTLDGDPGASPLFTVAGLQPAADVARQVIDNLATPDAITASPAISGAIFDIQAQLAKISGGLDFWGHWTSNVPIWTFDYLQSVATNFCQLAIGAERDAMTFWEKSEAGQLTQLQLTQTVAVARAEREAASRQLEAAQAEQLVYMVAEAAAWQRATNARANAQEYEQKSRQWTLHQALSAELSGGEHGVPALLNQLADVMMRDTYEGGYAYEGGAKTGTVAAAQSLTAARLQSEYEIDVLKRQADELEFAAGQAVTERQAAAARVAALQAAEQAAKVRAQSAVELAAAFDDQRFTPSVWYALGERMNDLAQRYLVMALDVAKRMQRSYNFENDVERAIIKADYSRSAVMGLLAADALMADVQSFTYDQVTSTAPKPQPMRQTISLAQRYPFLFETQLRTTGRMEFQTTIDDFDSLYPGSYAGRIEHVEVEVDGIVPPRGIRGTLTNSGISHYRLPSALWNAGTSGLKHRLQVPETLVLSDYDVRVDALVVEADRRRRRVFEGAGVASSWTLELPRDVNEIDYASLMDVRLTFTYQARHDPDVKQRVLAELAARPSVNERQRPIPLRWMYPDAFFSFYGTGVLDVTLGVDAFARYEGDPQLTELSLVVITSPRARSADLVLRVTAPGGAPIEVTTDADGIVPTDDLAAVAGGDAVGDYRIVLDPDDNPTWLVDGQLDVEAIQNIAVVVGYSFTPRT